MKAWRAAPRVDARRTPAPVQPASTGFIADCAGYLQAVAAMPSHSDRVRLIGEWLVIFGDCDRQTDITSSRIRMARDSWLTVGPKRVQVKGPNRKRVWEARAIPLSASTVNGRLRALENLFTVLDSRRAYNPVRESQEPTRQTTRRARSRPT